MSLIKNIFIVLVVAVILFLVINHFFLRTNIIWDDIVQGHTSSGGLDPTLISTSADGLTGGTVPLPFMSSSFTSETSLSDFVGNAGQTGLIVPNSAFPTTMTSNIMFSIWFFIEDYTTNLGNNKYICSLIGNNSGVFNPSLVLFLTPNNNNFGIAIRTQNTSGSASLNFYYIENIPLQKWNCLILSVVDRTLDVYLDGKLVNSFILEGFYTTLPQTSLYVGNNKNNYFTGFVTRARYDNGGVNPQQAYSIYKEGIRTSFTGDFLNKYRLKVGLYEYNNRVGGFTI